MAKNDKKMVDAITSMDEDFAQWYTDIVKKAELIAYRISSASSTACSRRPVTRT